MEMVVDVKSLHMLLGRLGEVVEGNSTAVY